MKKYIAPEVEIKKFNVENIMAESSATVTVWDENDTNLDNSTTITYNQLFGLGSN